MSKFIVKMNVTVSTQTLSNGRNIFHFTISSLIIDFSNDHLTFETRGNVMQAIAENYKKQFLSTIKPNIVQQLKAHIMATVPNKINDMMI